MDTAINDAVTAPDVRETRNVALRVVVGIVSVVLVGGAFIGGVAVGAARQHRPASSSVAAANVFRSPEVCGPLSHGADGTVGPVLCPDGAPNALVLGDLRNAAPHVIALGPEAEQTDIESAVCADMAASTIPIEEDAYTWNAAAYAWSFGVNVVDGTVPTCSSP